MMLTILQHKSYHYSPRTFHNASVADLTVAFAVDFTTAGEKQTHQAAKTEERYLALSLFEEPLPNARKLYKAFKAVNGRVLNVAGNGIYTLTKHDIWQVTCNLAVYLTLRQVHEHYPIQRIVSGGQTGVDIAGGIAGYKLGIETILTLPGGFVQRDADKVDRQHTEAEIRQQVIEGAARLP